MSTAGGQNIVAPAYPPGAPPLSGNEYVRHNTCPLRASTATIAPRNVAFGPDAPEAETPVKMVSPASTGDPVMIPLGSGCTSVIQRSAPVFVSMPSSFGALRSPTTKMSLKSDGLVRA